MSNPNPTADELSAAGSTVDELAAATGARLAQLTADRAGLVDARARMTARIKELDVEIDKATRMVRSLIPRGQRGRAAAPAVTS